jgi:glyoxylase-like metal-dependent hydrolase (beta-lactamase superfamily II)
MTRAVALLFAWGVLFASPALAQLTATFDASKLVTLGDEVKYGSYLVRKIGDGVYQINDPGDKSTKGGGWGVDMYLVCGARKALLIDLGNNYIAGYEKDGVKPRPNAAQEFRAMLNGLAGRLPLEVAVTHMHPDHDGMAGAFADGTVPMWAGDGEDLTALETQHNLDPSLFRTFKQGSTSFDLGGGHIVETFRVRGHSNGGTVYLLKKESLVFSGDALGSGFGQAFATVERLRQVAEDSRNLVDHIKAHYAPYERYGLKVFTGHSWQNGYGGFLHPNKTSVDVGYLDWRFIQDVSACANGILQGKWLVDGSGTKFMGTMVYTGAWGSAAGRAIMVSGIGTIILPLEVAYEAAGLPVPPELVRR